MLRHDSFWTPSTVPRGPEIGLKIRRPLCRGFDLLPAPRFTERLDAFGLSRARGQNSMVALLVAVRVAIAPSNLESSARQRVQAADHLMSRLQQASFSCNRYKTAQ